MPDLYGPFEGEPWSQGQWYRDAPLWAPSGVFGPPAPLSNMSAGDLGLTVNGLTLSLGLGRAHVRGAAYERTGTPATIVVPANTNPTLSRRDRIVLRRDLAARTVLPIRLQGTPAASPASPALQRDENGQWDLPLHSFLVQPNSSTALTDYVDERAFLGEGNFPTYITTRARDLAVPSPVDQQIVGASGKLWQRLGGAWREIAGDTGWVDLPLNSVAAQPRGATYRVLNGVCHFALGVIASAGFADDFVFAQFPEGVRPTKPFTFAGFYNSANAVDIEVDTQGRMRPEIGFAGTNVGLTVSGTFPVS